RRGRQPPLAQRATHSVSDSHVCPFGNLLLRHVPSPPRLFHSFFFGLSPTFLLHHHSLAPFYLQPLSSPALFFRLHPFFFSFLFMGRPFFSDMAAAGTNGRGDDGGGDQATSPVVDIYPLSSYYFGSKDALPFKDETLADRLYRMKSNYNAQGLRTCVEAVILVELFKHPHLLLLQERNSFFSLPGGRLRPGETDVDGLKRKLSRKLLVDDSENDWEVGEHLSTWWRPDFETLMYPYLPPATKSPKQCTKLFLVRLPERLDFIVPKNFKLLAVPLCQVQGNQKTYGQIISGVPQMLSKFSINRVIP
ncbi:unnamed protein product, partial [Linum tenue]